MRAMAAGIHGRQYHSGNAGESGRVQGMGYSQGGVYDKAWAYGKGRSGAGDPCPARGGDPALQALYMWCEKIAHQAIRREALRSPEKRVLVLEALNGGRRPDQFFPIAFSCL